MSIGFKVFQGVLKFLWMGTASQILIHYPPGVPFTILPAISSAGKAWVFCKLIVWQYHLRSISNNRLEVFADDLHLAVWEMATAAQSLCTLSMFLDFIRQISWATPIHTKSYRGTTWKDMSLWHWGPRLSPTLPLKTSTYWYMYSCGEVTLAISLSYQSLRFSQYLAEISVFRPFLDRLWMIPSGSCKQRKYWSRYVEKLILRLRSVEWVQAVLWSSPWRRLLELLKAYPSSTLLRKSPFMKPPRALDERHEDDSVHTHWCAFDSAFVRSTGKTLVGLWTSSPNCSQEWRFLSNKHDRHWISHRPFYCRSHQYATICSWNSWPIKRRKRRLTKLARSWNTVRDLAGCRWYNTGINCFIVLRLQYTCIASDGRRQVLMNGSPHLEVQSWILQKGYMRQCSQAKSIPIFQQWST